MSKRFFVAILSLAVFPGLNVLMAEEASKKETLKTVCQLTLDLEKLQPYFKLERYPERSPLNVVKNELVKGDFALKKFGRRVRYVTKDWAEKNEKPYFEFTGIEVKPDEVIVEYRYPPEAKRGKVSFRKDDGSWKVGYSSIADETYKIITKPKPPPPKKQGSKEEEALQESSSEAIKEVEIQEEPKTDVEEEKEVKE